MQREVSFVGEHADHPSRRRSFKRSDSRPDISDSLAEIYEKDPQEQAEFWLSCVDQKQSELAEIGGLPLDWIQNDILTRYFDSSARGIQVVYKAAVRDQSAKDKELLDKDGLYDAFSEHYNFYDVLQDEDQKVAVLENGANPHFDRICDVVGLPCSLESFAYVTRRLRIAMLLKHFECDHKYLKQAGMVFHCDYDDDDIHTPFEPHKDRRKVVHDQKWYSVPVVQPQETIKDFASYLFTNKMQRPGRVHWTHLHFPSMDLLLAVGQVWRLPGPALGMMCELGKAQPQISYLDPTKHTEDEDGHGYSWSYVVLPAVYLDHLSRSNLDVYRHWRAKFQDPVHRKTVSDTPPRVHIGVTRLTIGMMWSSTDANTIVSSATEPYYIGKWTTDSPEHHDLSFFRELLNKITCAGCCRRRKDHDGQGEYEKLATEDPEHLGFRDRAFSWQHEEKSSGHKVSGIEVSQELFELFGQPSTECESGRRATDEAQSCITFEKTFEHILQTLERQNSMLRLGDNWHLLTRIILNRSIEYLDVLDIYEAAITRIGYLLHSSEAHKKDVLVGEIEKIVSQLQQLERMITPFAHYVVPDLIKLGEKLQGDYPLVFHHVKDIQNNTRCFMPKVTDLISRCRNLTVEYDRMANDRTNNILNILTFITFVITPMQLMTGVYGMNFAIIPELQWKRGYAYFWCLSVTLSIAFALILVCLKRA